MTVDRVDDLGWWKRKARLQMGKTRPGQAPLRPAAQPVVPESPDLLSIHIDGLPVSGNTVVREIPQQHRTEVPMLVGDRLVPVKLAPEGDPLERPGKSTLR